MLSWMGINFQNENSIIMNEMIKFNDYLMIIIILIIFMIIYMMLLISYNKNLNLIMYNNNMLEIIWTIIPMLILLIIVFPSMKILYSIEENNPLISIKSIGHQWFWSYEYSDLMNIEMDSYMSQNLNYFRLLDVNNRLIIPFNMNIRVLTTSSDVIHSWTIPSFSIKSDAIPGRINQMNFFINRPGIYLGQCSEICGANHSFMPIMLESINLKSFMKWINNFS
uniref:Cytochrome c oxidase subunit 2 n=1 Tax=Acerella muscorum TaxID=187596 RepID=A0A0C4K4J9_9HEXA|nr:cytochrome c oxidase subunit II [Acerella muscorum]AHL42973.1 cytochrome c oxidase subunit II [Acerella muscorum]